MRPSAVIRRMVGAFIVLAVTASSATASPPLERSAFQRDMRKLWEDHITWTRLFIVEATGGLPGKDATAQRLLQNQDDIGNAIKPFYGDAAGKQLTALLRDHILIAADLVSAAAAGDAAKKDAAAKRWSANADQIADFLSSANAKNWPKDETRKMMHEHLALTTNEVVAQLGKDWKGSIAAYDSVHHQILHMADTLSSGIEKQFPAKFRA